jgi:hypothetical protein
MSCRIENNDFVADYKDFDLISVTNHKTKPLVLNN